MKGKNMSKKQHSKVRVMMLGGLNEIGKNLAVIEYEDDIVIIDCGIAFPDEDMLGVDLVIPDFTYLEKNADKVRGILVTHGHEDHIGSIPYLLKLINVPVYATRLTLGILESKLAEHKLLGTANLVTVAAGDTVKLGCFRAEFIRANHSIADACMIALRTPEGVIFHTGDFKLDVSPIGGEMMDLTRIGEYGREGILLLMCESTNVEKPGFTPSERLVGVSLDHIFMTHTDKRVIIATFSSNVHRVQQIINSSVRFGRKVAVTGRSMLNVVGAAQRLGYMDVPDGALIDITEIGRYPQEMITIITTGSQGESMAALSRMADGTHKKITIGQGDTVIFSSNPIPGNEKAITNVVNKLLIKGAEVIFQDVHVSGHPNQEDVKLIYTLVHPRFAIPVHGEYRHLKAQAGLAADLGIPKDSIFILRSGDILEMDSEHARMNGHVQTGPVLVDGSGVGDVGNAVLHDRQKLAEDGIVVVAVSIYSDAGIMAGLPEIISRGFIYEKMDETGELLQEAEEITRDAIEDCISSYDLSGGMNRNRLKNSIKDSLGSFFWKKTKRRPMSLPVVVEI